MSAIAVSCREWLDAGKTEKDVWREQQTLRAQLQATTHKLWQDYASEGNQIESGKWEKQWLKIHNCQMEWVGYRAACCGGKAGTIAVPIGCNHRLCPVCAWRRSMKARVRIKSMFDRLTHPVLLTLTIPNSDSIRKHDFTLFRQRIRKFLAQHKGWIKGGVYSIETTFNRREKTWHVHAHILADVSVPLPAKKDKVVLAGDSVYEFTALKLRLEFDWLRLWTTKLGKLARKDANAMRRAGDVYVFEEWVKKGRENRVREWIGGRGGRWQTIEGLSPAVIAVRNEWNRIYRRVIDIRPVTDRDGAAREVLKYITKVADFSDLPEAVEPFFNAVRGARLIQTFGSWYGVNFDEDFDPEHMDDWGEMKCPCGVNAWERIGVFFRADVVMDESGRWRLAPHLSNARWGTVPRPTIRALDGPRKDDLVTYEHGNEGFSVR